MSASFGLHPEPRADRAASSAEPALSPQAVPDAAAHACPACLSHRPISLTRPVAIVLRPEALVAGVADLVVTWPELLLPRPRQTRAPPVVS